MKIKLATLLVLTSSIFANPGFGQGQGYGAGNPMEPKLKVHNEVLVKINDQVITVMDVIKEMDVFFQGSNPELVNSKPARYQFYSSSWRQVLDQMINKELMILDAEGKLEVSEGEVREEIEKSFGPNIMYSLNKIDVTLEEIKEKVKKNIISQKMSWYFIHNRAMQAVTPKDIRKAYDVYLKENPTKTEWTYRVITVRADEEDLARDLSHKIKKVLDEKNTDLSNVYEEILALQDDKTSIKISNDFTNNSQDVSQNHGVGLNSLQEGQYSEPLAQFKATQKPTYRIFYLKDLLKYNPATFQAMTKKLQNDLIQKQSEIENENYISKLRKQYGMDQTPLLVPEDFNPFSMQ